MLDIVVPPSFLDFHRIPYVLVPQTAGMTIHLDGEAHHWGANTGAVLNWAINVEGGGISGTGCGCGHGGDPKAKALLPRPISMRTVLA